MGRWSVQSTGSDDASPVSTKLSWHLTPPELRATDSPKPQPSKGEGISYVSLPINAETDEHFPLRPTLPSLVWFVGQQRVSLRLSRDEAALTVTFSFLRLTGGPVQHKLRSRRQTSLCALTLSKDPYTQVYTYSMYSRLFSFVTMISDPFGFRST